MIIKLVLALALLLSTALSAQSPSRRADRCTAPRDLPQKSFLRIDGLDLKFTFVWVDDIQSKLVGGYDPFDVFIVSGTLYTPFEVPAGKLERPAFERLSSPGKNLERFGPFRVPAAIDARNGVAFPFVSNSARYQLRILGVKPARFGGEDVVTIQICRG